MSTAASLQAALIGQRAAAAQNAGGQANELIASAMARAAQQRMQAAQIAAQLREQQRQRQIEAQLQTQQMLGSMFQNQANQQAAMQRQLGEQEFQSVESRRERQARAGMSEADRLSREKIAGIEADSRRPVRTPSQQLDDMLANRAMNDPVLFDKALNNSLGVRDGDAEGSPEEKAAAEFLSTVDVSKGDSKARLDAIAPNLGSLLPSLTPETREKVVRTYKALGGDEKLLYQQPAAQPAAAPGNAVSGLLNLIYQSGPRAMQSMFSMPQESSAPGGPTLGWQPQDFNQPIPLQWQNGPPPGQLPQATMVRPPGQMGAPQVPGGDRAALNALRVLQAQRQREQAMRQLMGMP